MGLSDTSPHYTGFLSASLSPAAAAAVQCTHLPDTEHFQGRLPASTKNSACNVQAYFKTCNVGLLVTLSLNHPFDSLKPHTS